MSEEIFIIFSKCTNMPYIYCEPKDLNDEIFVFFKEEDAKAYKDKKLLEEIPLQVAKIQKEYFLSFYSNLYMMGVNAVCVDEGTQGEIEILLKELVIRPNYEELPKGQVKVENPQLHLTALYFMQTLRKKPKQEITPEMKEMEEELIANLQKGKFIVPLQGENMVPFMKMQNGDAYQPIFTDISEFKKFNVKDEFRGVVVPYEKLQKVLVEQSKGIVLNPMGFRLVLLKNHLA